MKPIDWSSSEEFGVLCDLVASDHLVCLTGAGISRGLRRKHAPNKTLPGWVSLLRELLLAFEPRLAPMDAASARRLLDAEDERLAAGLLRDAVRGSMSGAAQGDALGWMGELGPHIGSDELILAASIIREPDPTEFDKRFLEAISEAPGECSPTHEAILDLVPRGILTFNYDGGHEEACRRRGHAYIALNPTDGDSEQQFRDLLERRLKDFFLLKAHGSVDSASPLVLTTAEYRNLLGKNPSFRAFVQNLFTNFSFLMVGYGLDDPDFDLFLRTMAEQFAGPLQHHVVLRPLAQRHRREEVERRLYGIHTLHINDFPEVPGVLRQAATTAGPALRRSLDDCLSVDHHTRRRAHAMLENLGPAGRAVAGQALVKRLSDHDSFIVSEAAYSLGLLDADRHLAGPDCRQPRLR